MNDKAGPDRHRGTNSGIQAEGGELGLQRLIVDWLTAQGHAVWLNEVPQGMISRNSPTGRRRAANRGSADIVGTLKGGRMICIEVKAPGEKGRIQPIWQALLQGDYTAYARSKDQHLKEQMDFLLWQRQRGALAIIAFSLDDAINATRGIS